MTYIERIFLRITRWKNFDNRSTFAKVIIKHQVAYFFWDTVYVKFICISQLHFFSVQHVKHYHSSSIVFCTVSDLRSNRRFFCYIHSFVLYTVFTLQCCLQRIFNKQTSYFWRLKSAFSQTNCLKFAFKFINFSRSYAKKRRGYSLVSTLWTECENCRHSLHDPMRISLKLWMWSR